MVIELLMVSIAINAGFKKSPTLPLDPSASVKFFPAASAMKDRTSKGPVEGVVKSQMVAAVSHEPGVSAYS